MRATVGILSILGLSISVAMATAQAPRSMSAPQRRAILLPPEPLAAAELPRVARATAEELPSEPAMTPVVRPAARTAATGPGWLNGMDPNVRPASGVGTQPSSVRPINSRNAAPKDEPSLVSKGLGKLKEAFGGNARPDSADRAPENLPPGMATVAANANTAFRGATATGAPVYAGPPAYRWYGWGSVTPGANPYAPAGQYPPASANWYSITGATPGAFPVPVTNPARSGPGTEPPVYVVVPNHRVAPGTNNIGADMPMPGTTRAANPVRQVPPPVDLSRIEPPSERRPTPTPTISAPPIVVVPAPVVAPVTTDQEPPIRPITSLPPLPELSESAVGESTVSLPNTLPAPLPVSVMEDQTNWQPKSETIAPGDWAPARGKTQTAPSPKSQPAPNWQQPGASIQTPAHAVIRAQSEESQPDPTIGLIRGLCAGRATGMEIRWTGSTKLAVRFTCRDAEEARRLINDISARRELTPLRIDFSVGVK